MKMGNEYRDAVPSGIVRTIIPFEGGVPLQVLVVDDDSSVLSYLVDVLSTGHRVKGVLVTGEESLRECDAAVCDLAPDVLVTDYEMPIAVARVLETVRARGPQVRVLLHTGSHVSEAERVRLGIERVLTKPCGGVALLEAVQGPSP
jgi:CheY-like chemotaxis protein